MEALQKKRLTGAAVIVMSSIIVSRVTGFIREMMIPAVLGVNSVGDAYNIAFLIPDLMYNLLVGGAVAAALIPILAGYIERKEEEEGWKAVGTFINVIIGAMVVACILGMIFTPQLVQVVASGYGKSRPVEFGLAVKLTRILFPSVAFLMLAGLCNGVLNSYHRFAAAAYGPAIYNAGSALSILLLYRRGGVESVAWGVMCSSLVYFLFQLSFALRNFKLYRPRFHLKHSGFLRLFRLAVPSMLASSIVQVNVIVSARFATFFNEGSVTALRMADRTWQLPLGVFAQGMGIAMLPTLSATLAAGAVKDYKNILLKGLKTVLLLSIPSAVGFIILRESIIRTAFKFTHKVDEHAVVVTGGILMFFSIALLTQSIVAVVNRAFYAGNDTKTPLFIGASTIVVNIVCSKLFIAWTSLGVAGMALSYSIASTLNAVLLLVMLNKKMKGIYLDKLAAFVLKVLPAALAMGAVLLVMERVLPLEIHSKLVQITCLGAKVLAGAVVYFGVVLLVKVEEAVYISRIILERLKSVGGRLLKRSIN